MAKAVRTVKVGVISACLGGLAGIALTAGLEPPPDLKGPEVKYVQLPAKVEVREVPGPETFMPLPESCEDLIDLSKYTTDTVFIYHRPIGQALLTLEQELMPAALLGDVADLNDANIKVNKLFHKGADPLKDSFRLRKLLDAYTFSCTQDLEAAKSGDDYDAGDGEQTTRSVLDSLYSGGD